MYDSTKNVAGGGLRVLALCLAVILLILGGAMHPIPFVQAADEGWHLYQLRSYENSNEDFDPNGMAEIVEVGENRTYTAFGAIPLSAGTGSVHRGAVCVIGSNGDKYYFEGGVTSDRAFVSNLEKLNTVDSAACQPVGYLNSGSKRNWISQRSITGSTAHGEQYSVDREGSLWLISNQSEPSAFRLPFSDYEFSAVSISAANRGTAFQNDGVAFVLGRPRSQKADQMMVQMPTTGAPVGLSAVGLTALLIGLAAVGIDVVRRAGR